jgi:transposase InsO family protein
LDLIAVVEAGLNEIVELGHTLRRRLFWSPTTVRRSRRGGLKTSCRKTALLIHVRSRKYHPQTIGREKRFHGSLKLEHLYRVLPRNRTELIQRLKATGSFTITRA